LDQAEGLDEHWREKLMRFAEDFRALRAQVKALDPDDADFGVLRGRALAALDAGRLDEAKTLLRSIDTNRAVSVTTAQKALIQAAEVKAVLGRIALLEFSFLEAAAHFRDADDTLPGKESEKRHEYREAEADAWYRQGELGDNDALCKATDLYRELLVRTPRETLPLDWARMQSNLGLALWALCTPTNIQMTECRA
jgi:hypothetical protein